MRREHRPAQRDGDSDVARPDRHQGRAAGPDRRAAGQRDRVPVLSGGRRTRGSRQNAFGHWTATKDADPMIAVTHRVVRDRRIARPRPHLPARHARLEAGGSYVYLKRLDPMGVQMGSRLDRQLNPRAVLTLAARLQPAVELQRRRRRRVRQSDRDRSVQPDRQAAQQPVPGVRRHARVHRGVGPRAGRRRGAR